MRSIKSGNTSRNLIKFILGLLIIAGILTGANQLSNVKNFNLLSFNTLPTWEVEDPVSTVFVMDSIPPTAGSLAAGDSTVPNEYLIDSAMDTLLLLMSAKNIYLHRTFAQPSGLVGGNDIVVIKGNFQNEFRNSTSTDRIKGLVWQILQHPEGFSGEILISDNTQGSTINEEQNNSEDPDQTITDVVNTFYSKGYSVYLVEWKNIMDDVVQEYSNNDYTDGYTYDEATKISYPKFKTPSGNYFVSLRYGIWDSTMQTYNAEQLSIVDFPVLKAHGWAGATIGIKNWVGVLTIAYANNRYGGFNPMHEQYFFGSYALVAKVMGVTYPKLTIVDAAWTNIHRHYGSDNVNTRMLLGSTDPSAVSWYAAKFILTPIALNPNNTNPDLSGGTYNINLTAWTNCLADSGFSSTMDSSEISVYDREVLSVTANEELFKSTPDDVKLYQNYANPFNPTTKLHYELSQSSYVTLKIYDVLGNEVEILVDEEKPAGVYEIIWNAKTLPSGVYFYKFEAGDFVETKKMILLK